MTHFTVLVIGENPEKQLAPYHEFECTGEDNEYVQDIDVTEEYLKDYNEGTRTMMHSNIGEFRYSYDDFFYREPTAEEQKQIGIGGTGCTNNFSYTSKDWLDGKGFRSKVKYIPDGWEQLEIPYKELMTFESFIRDYENISEFGSKEDTKYGYYKKEGDKITVINRTNPNSRWDWYQIGGRWAGSLKLKEEAKGNLQFPTILGICADLDKERLDNYKENKKNRVADQAIKGDIDFSLDDEEYSKYIRRWELCVEDAIPKDKKEEEIKMWAYKKDYYLKRYKTKDNYARISTQFSTAAVIKDGEWIEPGEHGWFGTTSATPEQEGEWEDNFYNNFIKDLPEDTLLTVVDCHI